MVTLLSTKFLILARVLEAIGVQVRIVLVAMLSPGVPSITEYFTFASLGVVNGTSKSLELVSVADGGDGRQ